MGRQLVLAPPGPSTPLATPTDGETLFSVACICGFVCSQDYGAKTARLSW